MLHTHASWKILTAHKTVTHLVSTVTIQLVRLVRRFHFKKEFISLQLKHLHFCFRSPAHILCLYLQSRQQVWLVHREDFLSAFVIFETRFTLVKLYRRAERSQALKQYLYVHTQVERITADICVTFLLLKLCKERQSENREDNSLLKRL